MAPPTPPVPLKEHCSIIHDNVLYVYSPDALQSLPLQMDAKWNQEPMGISVTGATCVLGGVDGDHSRAALYVVGGSTNSSSIQYPGLQRYLLQERRWDNIEPIAPVTRNRKHHGTAFLNASSSILVYGGSQDGDNNPSTQTFLIETWPPYNVRSFISLAPPVVDPIMLAWADNRGAMIGGNPTNNQVFTFGPDDGWADAGVALVQSPPDHSVAQSALLSLVDRSKVLITFDLSRSPNTVTRTVLLNPGGQQAQYGQTVGNSATPSRRRRRNDVLLATFPPYNDSLAPQNVRTGASLAQDSSGLIVITGGNDQDPLVIFDALQNRWIEPTTLLGGESQNPSIGSPTSSVTLPTASASSTSESAASGSRTQSSTILGAVLGSVCGMAALLIIALLLLRRRRKNNSTLGRHTDFSDHKISKDGRLSFEDQGIQPIRAAAEPMGHTGVPSTHDMTTMEGNRSHIRQSSSMTAWLHFDQQRASKVSSRAGILSRKKSSPSISTAIKETAELQERPRISGLAPPPRAATFDPSGPHRKNDAGWSTYFSGNTAVDLTSYPNNVTLRTSHSPSGNRGSYWPDPAAPVTNLRFGSPGLTDSNGHQLARLHVQKGSPLIGRAAVDGVSHSVAMTEDINGENSTTESPTRSGPNYHNLRLNTDNKIDAGNAYPDRQSANEYGWAFQDSSWSGPRHQLNRPPSSNYTSSIYPFNVTSPKGEGLSNPSTKRATQWPWQTTALSPSPQSRMSTWNEHSPGGRLTRLRDEIRDYFGSHRRQEQENDMSWLSLNGNSNSNSSGHGNRDRIV